MSLNTTIYEGLTDEQILSVRSLHVIADVLERDDLIELLLLERKQNILKTDFCRELLLGGIAENDTDYFDDLSEGCLDWMGLG